MAWDDRLREAAYTSPGGTRLTFTYEQVSEEFDQKGRAFDFADADGTYMQPLGRTGRRYPLRIILWGADYDQAAAQWMNALGERGEAVLEHPLYGRKVVVPLGTIKRRDDPVNAGNQAVIEATFFETTGAVYGVPVEDIDGFFEELRETCNTSQADQILETGVFDDVGFLAEFRVAYNATLSTVSNALNEASRELEGVQKTKNAIQASIERGIDVLIGDPIALARQTQALIQSVASVEDSTRLRLSIYLDQFSRLTSAPAASLPEVANFDLFNSAIAVSFAQGAINTAFTRRPQAIDAAESVLDIIEDLAEWRDQSYAALDTVDSGGSWQATQALLAFTAGALVEQAFDLATERSVILSSDRTIVDLAFELYGEVDERLDDLINDNDLSGDEIIEIPRGREVVYYAP